MEDDDLVYGAHRRRNYARRHTVLVCFQAATSE